MTDPFDAELGQRLLEIGQTCEIRIVAFDHDHRRGNAGAGFDDVVEEPGIEHRERAAAHHRRQHARDRHRYEPFAPFAPHAGRVAQTFAERMGRPADTREGKRQDGHDASGSRRRGIPVHQAATFPPLQTLNLAWELGVYP